MVNRAVSDTSPILHLNEINLLKIFDIFDILVPEQVVDELIKNKIILPKKIKVEKLKAEGKDTIKVLTNDYNLDIGEAAAIALFLQKKANYFFTDDLDARQAAKQFNIKVHGTIGIILRALREKIIDKEIAHKKVVELYSNSSMFISKDLVYETLKAIKEFKNKENS